MRARPAVLRVASRSPRPHDLLRVGDQTLALSGRPKTKKMQKRRTVRATGWLTEIRGAPWLADSSPKS